MSLQRFRTAPFSGKRGGWTILRMPFSHLVWDTMPRAVVHNRTQQRRVPIPSIQHSHVIPCPGLWCTIAHNSAVFPYPQSNTLMTLCYPTLVLGTLSAAPTSCGDSSLQTILADFKTHPRVYSKTYSPIDSKTYSPVHFKTKQFLRSDACAGGSPSHLPYPPASPCSTLLHARVRLASSFLGLDELSLALSCVDMHRLLHQTRYLSWHAWHTPVGMHGTT
eukprot:366208-Chlamydomonas_euryale.AAC.3